MSACRMKRRTWKGKKARKASESMEEGAVRAFELFKEGLVVRWYAYEMCDVERRVMSREGWYCEE